jgi:hypothetical protein
MVLAVALPLASAGTVSVPETHRRALFQPEE